MNRQAVFLDRDGVLNRSVVRGGKPYPPESLDGFELLPGVPTALQRLRDAGFLLIVVTNQPDVATGRQSRAVVDAMHDYLRRTVPLDDIKACFEEDHPTSTCYKPKPGMLLDAAAQWRIDLPASYMVGDRWRDVDCGHAVGCYTVFVDHGYAEKLNRPPDAVCTGLPEAADLILAHAGRNHRCRRPFP